MNYLPTSKPLLHTASGFRVLIDSWLTTWQSFYAMYLLTKSESEGFGRFATVFLPRALLSKIVNSMHAIA